MPTFSTIFSNFLKNHEEDRISVQQFIQFYSTILDVNPQIEDSEQVLLITTFLKVVKYKHITGVDKIYDNYKRYFKKNNITDSETFYKAIREKMINHYNTQLEICNYMDELEYVLLDNESLKKRNKREIQTLVLNIETLPQKNKCDFFKKVYQENLCKALNKNKKHCQLLPVKDSGYCTKHNRTYEYLSKYIIDEVCSDIMSIICEYYL
jgi:hypothetical protein